MNFLRSPDDDRADRAHWRALYEAAQRRVRSEVFGACRRCGMVEQYLLHHLCQRCAEDTEWSRANRAWCELIHRETR